MAIFLVLFLFYILLYCWSKNIDNDVPFTPYALMILFALSSLAGLIMIFISKKNFDGSQRQRRKLTEEGSEKGGAETGKMQRKHDIQTL